MTMDEAPHVLGEVDRRVVSGLPMSMTNERWPTLAEVANRAGVPVHAAGCAERPPCSEAASLSARRTRLLTSDRDDSACAYAKTHRCSFDRATGASIVARGVQRVRRNPRPLGGSCRSSFQSWLLSSSVRPLYRRV
jgi:hypothetical protein